MRTSVRVVPIVFAILAVPLLASAQDAGTYTSTIPPGWIITRENSPRAYENGGTVPAPSSAGTSVPVTVGLRDCSCGEVWHIVGSLLAAGNYGVATSAEFWVGTTADSCTTALQRGETSAVGGGITCNRIAILPQIVAGTLPLDVRVPVGYLVNPTTGACDTTDVVTQGQTSGSLYFSVVYLPNADAAPVQTFSYGFDYVSPTAANTVTVSPQESGAMVSWIQGSVSVEGGTPVPDPDVSSGGGFYIVSWPPPDTVPTRLAADDATCDGPGVDTAALADTVDESVDVVDADDVVEAGDVLDDAEAADEAIVDTGVDTGTDTGVDAGFDGGIDAGFDAATDAGDDSSTANGMCDPASPPPTLVDSNNVPSVYLTNDTLFRTIAATDYIPYGGATAATVTGLTNNRGYRFAVITQDNAGNRTATPWSECVVPKPVTDFYQRYVDAGGQAQAGRFCNVGVVGPSNDRPWTAAALAGALVAFAARRRARGQRSGR